MTERWAKIAWARGYYVCTTGDVVDSTGHPVIQSVDQDGYTRVKIYAMNGKRRTVRVHRLVADAFLENPDKLPQVNHLDGAKENNRADNLEWCDQMRNMRHAVEHGLFAGKRTESKIPVSVIGRDGVSHTYMSMADAARAMNVGYKTVFRAAARERLTAGGVRIFKHPESRRW